MKKSVMIGLSIGIIVLITMIVLINNYMDSRNKRFKPLDSYSEEYQHLAEAIYKDKARRVKKIIKEEGLDVNFTDEKNGYTPLLYGIRNSSSSVVETLLKLGADPNKSCNIFSGKDILTRYPLSQSIYNQDIWYLRILLEYGANPDLGDPLYFVILKAKENNKKPMIKLLIENGADINKENAWGSPALYEAALCNRYDLVNYLLDLGADPLVENSEGDTLMNRMQKDYKSHTNKKAFLDYLSPTLHRLKRRGIEVELED